MSDGPMVVARAAQQAVERKDRAAWLACFAVDCHVEDPVGHVPALSGREALAGFWDAGIAPMQAVSFAPTRAWEAGDDVMIAATVTVSVDGATTVSYDGAFLYTLGAEGTIASLRAFWDLPAVMAELASGGTRSHASRRADSNR